MRLRFPGCFTATTVAASVTLTVAIFSVGGIQGKQSPCGNKTVKISTSAPEGAVPETVILCHGDTVTWTLDDPSKIKDFRVDIDQKDDPFDDNGPFTSKKARSGKAKRPGSFEHYRYFKYTLTVTDSDGKTLPPYDPHGIIIRGP